MSELAKKYPCLEFNLSVIDNEPDRVSLFYSFLNKRGVAVTDIEMLSALYSTMGLLERRYTKEELSELPLSDVTCDSIEVGDGSLCCACTESAKYANRWWEDECHLLAACFAYDGLRETLRRRYKTRVDVLFGSYIRASSSMKESLYLPVNRFVFSGYNTIFFEWIQRIEINDDVINDLAQRAFPAINDAIKQAYPKWRSTNEAFLLEHISSLVRHAMTVKKPVEYYVQLAAKMYESLKPAKQKKVVQGSNSLPSDALGNVGLLLSNEAILADYNAKQRMKAKEKEQVFEDKTEKPVVAKPENIEQGAEKPVGEPSVEEVKIDTEPVNEEEFEDVSGKESLEVDVASSELTASVEAQKEVAPVASVVTIDELRTRKRVASLAAKNRGLSDSGLRNFPIPFRPSLTFSALYEIDGVLPKDENDIPEWRKGFLECCEEYNIIYIDSPSKLESLDATILSNDIVACEVLKDTLGEYLVIYLPKQGIFVMLPSNMLAQTSAILTTFFGLKNMIKLTCYPLPLFNWLCREMLPCEGVYDLRTISGMVWHERLSSYSIDEIRDYRHFIRIVSGAECDGSRPDIIYGLPKYRVIFLEARRVLGQGSYMQVLRREMAYLLLVGRSYNLLGIVNNCPVPFIDYELTHEGLGRVVYGFSDKTTFIDGGCLVCGKYLSVAREEDGIMKAYKEVCIKMVLSHYFDRYDPMLISLDEEDGIMFYVSERDCADFYTLLNRYLIKCGSFYVSSEPVVSMEIVSV